MSIDADGQRRDLNFGGFKGTNLAAGVDPADAVRMDQLNAADMLSMSKEAEVDVLLSAAETIVAQFAVDFDEMSSANITAQLSAFLALLAGVGTTTARLYTGASAYNVIDGTERATFNHNTATFTAKTNRGASFAKPAGVQIVQVTLQNSAASVSGAINGLVVNFRGA